MNIDLKHWPLMRIIRLAVAVGCFIAYSKNGEWFVLIIGALALLQAIFNTGCSDGNCEV